jgi:hypothetical protein
MSKVKNKGKIVKLETHMEPQLIAIGKYPDGTPVDKASTLSQMEPQLTRQVPR